MGYIFLASLAALGLRYMGVDWWFIGLGAGAFIVIWLMSDTKPSEPAQKVLRLNDFIDIVRQEPLREQFQEVAALVAQATNPTEAKRAMLKVHKLYPDFAEAARLLQIISESLAIADRTKNAKTFESRMNLARSSQEQLWQALPFEMDDDTKAKMSANLNVQFVELADEDRKLPAPSSASAADDEEESSSLHAQATALKAAGQLDEAVAKLYRAKSLMLESDMSHTAESWCKLPLYLQHANRYEESMVEFQFLLNDLARRARKDSRIDDSNFGPEKSKNSFHDLILKNDRETIEAKMALAQKRQLKRK
jgi:hypothetical protein